MIALWARIALAQWRSEAWRTLATVCAIAAGVALSSAVWFVNATALGEFSTATRRLVGSADLIVRGPARSGFPDALYAELARLPGVEAASPVVQIETGLPGRRFTLEILGIDPLRAGTLQPALFGEIAGDVQKLFAADAIYLSPGAADALGVAPGGKFDVLVGDGVRTLEVAGILAGTPEAADAGETRSTAGGAARSPAGTDTRQIIGVMDIASAQWTLQQVGRLNRIDLRLAPGVDRAAFQRTLAAHLPAGVVAVPAAVERDRAATVTRAYRVNLNMLALVSLLTGSFLVFATQSLSVLRRRTALALLRALGMTRGALQRALFAEGVALGAIGSTVGVVAGTALAAIVLARLNGPFGSAPAGNPPPGAGLGSFTPQPLAMLAFVAIGTAVASIGAWLPAREAASRPAALALKAGDAEPALAPLRGIAPGLALLAIGGVLAFLPPVGGLPVFGYLAIALLLFGGVLLVPRMTAAVLALAPRSGRVALDLGLGQLRGSIGLFTMTLAAMIVSFSLMVAMATMVFSFRVSFVDWLGRILPADLQLRVAQGSDSVWLDTAAQARIAALPGIARAQFRRATQLLIDPARQPVTLISRELVLGDGADALPVVRAASGPRPAGLPPIAISESMQDIYGWRAGQVVQFSLGGQPRSFFVAALYRDFARSSGTVLIAPADYQRHTGDTTATEGSLTLRAGASPAAVTAAVRALLPSPDALDIFETTELKSLSLRIFDRAFLVTYALEAVAVVIGLLGVAVASGSTALSRRAEFGMLRHIGLLRRQIMGMLAGEGLLTGALGVAYGLGLGLLLSLVLVYVVNRQSFNWSVDLAIPWTQLAVLCVSLVAAATLAAVVSGRAAMSRDALRSVREDW
jgi:putative ABC transport system permease protein